MILLYTWNLKKEKNPPKKVFQEKEQSLGLGEKLAMTCEDEGRKDVMDVSLVLGKQRLGKKPGK